MAKGTILAQESHNGIRQWNLAAIMASIMAVGLAMSSAIKSWYRKEAKRVNGIHTSA